VQRTSLIFKIVTYSLHMYVESHLSDAVPRLR
jgi:hypothetical protein